MSRHFGTWALGKWKAQRIWMSDCMHIHTYTHMHATWRAQRLTVRRTKVNASACSDNDDHIAAAWLHAASSYCCCCCCWDSYRPRSIAKSTYAYQGATKQLPTRMYVCMHKLLNGAPTGTACCMWQVAVVQRQGNKAGFLMSAGHSNRRKEQQWHCGNKRGQ